MTKYAMRTPCNVTCGDGYQVLVMNISKQNEFLYKYCQNLKVKSRPCHMATCSTLWNMGWAFIGICIFLVVMFTVCMVICCLVLARKTDEKANGEKEQENTPSSLSGSKIRKGNQKPRKSGTAKTRRRRRSSASASEGKLEPVEVEVSEEVMKMARSSKSKSKMDTDANNVEETKMAEKENSGDE